jgi:drug/metabolite transporter (DMT)-like permease
MVRKLAPTIDLLLTTGAQFLVGGLILAGASALFEPWGTISWSAGSAMSLLILGVVGTGLAYVAWFWLLARTSLVRLGAVLFLLPVVGVAAAVIVGDRPAPVALLGIAAVLVGIWIVSAAEPSPGSGIVRRAAKRRTG